MHSRSKWQGMGGAVATALILFAAPSVEAQTPPPSQLTPETLRPAPAAEGRGVSIPQSSPLAVPAGAEALSVRINRVTFEGQFPELADAVAVLSQSVIGKRLTVAQLYAYAFAVEQAYAAAGYVLVRVVVPPQELVDGGMFKLVVVDGYVEDVEVATLSRRVRDVVKARLADLIGRRRITLSEIERRVLLAGEVPGLRLRSTLVQGRETGGTRLVLEGSHRLVQGSLDTNNFLEESYGRWQFSQSAALNSALGFGEQFYGTYGGADDLASALEGTSPLRIFGGGVVIPLGADGLSLNPEYTQSRSNPLITSPGQIEIEDVFERVAVRLAYPVVLSRSRTFRVQGIYEHITSDSEAVDFDVDLNRDRYDVARLSADHSFLTNEGWSVFASGVVSQGLGGRDHDDALASGIPLSRQGASPEFSKLYLEGRIAFPLPRAFRLDLAGRAQTSFGDALLESEQMSLDSQNVLSGFDSGSIVVDSGLAGRIELSRGFVFSHESWASVVTPYVFGAAGRGSLEDPTAVEQESVTATSYGLGLRANIDTSEIGLGGSLSFEAARHNSDDPFVEDGYRGSFSAGVRF